MAITKATASSVAPAAKGDLVVGSGTNDAAVLAVGSANQVLTVDSSTGTGLKWAAVSSGAVALVTAQAIGSGVSSVTITNAFSTTYDSYRVVLSNCTSSIASGNSIKVQLGASTTGYYWSQLWTSYNATVAGQGGANSTYWLVGSLDNGPSHMAIDIFQPYLALPTYFTSNANFTTGRAGPVNGAHNVSTSYTDLKLTPELGTFTGGTVYVYGFAKA